MRPSAFALLATLSISCHPAPRPAFSTASIPGDRPGILLEDLSWVEAERVLTRDAVVVLPIGAASKEHGPHLKLKNDLLIADYLKQQVLERAKVVILPTVLYHYYPAFLEYPGSVSLRLETARDMVVDICRSISRYGPRRFYALNTGVSTVRALAPAAEELAREGILLRYTDILKAAASVEAEVRQEQGGTHADEIETSMMLVIDPSSVDMSKAAKDYDPDAKGPLTRTRGVRGSYSPSGVWGDATLATREKGVKVLTAIVDSIVREILEVRAAQLP